MQIFFELDQYANIKYIYTVPKPYILATAITSEIITIILRRLYTVATNLRVLRNVYILTMFTTRAPSYR